MVFIVHSISMISMVCVSMVFIAYISMVFSSYIYGIHCLCTYLCYKYVHGHFCLRNAERI